MASGSSKIVYDTVKHLRGASDETVRDAVTAAYRSHGEHSPSEIEIDLVVAAVQRSPLRAGVSLLGKGAGWTARFLGEARRADAPKWMKDSPEDVNCEWGDDDHEPTLLVPVIIEPATVAAARSLFRDAPQSFGDARKPLTATTVRTIWPWCEGIRNGGLWRASQAIECRSMDD